MADEPKRYDVRIIEAYGQERILVEGRRIPGRDVPLAIAHFLSVLRYAGSDGGEVVQPEIRARLVGTKGWKHPSAKLLRDVGVATREGVGTTVMGKALDQLRSGT